MSMNKIRRKSANLQKFGRFIFGLEEKSRRNIENIIQLINPKKVLIVGSAEVGAGTQLLYETENFEIVGIDIYESPTVTKLCDAHNLTFEDNSFDFVVCQAVLEHVHTPQLVVNEIHRVLKPGGVVYSEIPFLQAVHEYPYDYTRFTREGHRELYSSFEVIEAGINGGYLNASAWAFRYLILSIFRVRIISILLSIPIFLFSKIVEKNINCENSFMYSGTYLCAKK